MHKKKQATIYLHHVYKNYCDHCAWPLLVVDLMDRLEILCRVCNNHDSTSCLPLLSCSRCSQRSPLKSKRCSILPIHQSGTPGLLKTCHRVAENIIGIWKLFRITVNHLFRKIAKMWPWSKKMMFWMKITWGIFSGSNPVSVPMQLASAERPGSLKNHNL